MTARLALDWSLGLSTIPALSRRFKLTLTLLVAGLISPLVAGSGEPTLAQRLLDVARKLVTSEQEGERLERAKTDEAGVLQQLEAKESALQHRLNAIQSELRRARSDAMAAEQSRVRAEKRLNALAANLAAVLTSEYQRTFHRSMAAGLFGDSPDAGDSAQRSAGYWGYFQDARLIQLAQLRQAQFESAQAVESARTKANAVKVVSDRLQETYAELQTTKEEHSLAFQRLHGALRQKEREVAELKSAEARVKSLLAQASIPPQSVRGHDESASSNAEVTGGSLVVGEFLARRGRLPWPVEGTITAAFGSPRLTGQWDGVLIRVAVGQQVRTVHSGRVAFADRMPGYGLMAIIDHGGGFMSLYAYNQRLMKSVGDWVTAGEVIARGGATDEQTEPYLYFGIREQGQPLDPAQWCS